MLFLMGPKPPKKTPDSDETSVELEIDPLYLWRVEQMEKAGLEHFTAFRVAFNDADWRRAVELHEAGATDQQIIDILI